MAEPEILVEARYQRELSGELAVYGYLVSGTEDATDAREAVVGEAPATHGSLTRSGVEVRWLAPDTWDAEVRYTPPGTIRREPETGESVFAFDTTGGTQHITQSGQTAASYAAQGQPIPDFGGAIGATEDGAVEGCDIIVPVYTWSETWYKPAAAVDLGYRAQVALITGYLNDAAWRGFEAREILFLGASGSQRGAGDWEITYRFSWSRHRTNIFVGRGDGAIDVLQKDGWDYLWVEYRTKKEAASKRLISYPASVHVERVYLAAPFSLLEIGD